jgi:hypothetical protein
VDKTFSRRGFKSLIQSWIHDLSKRRLKRISRKEFPFRALRALLETSHDCDEITFDSEQGALTAKGWKPFAVRETPFRVKSASPQRACQILGASGVPCDEAGLLAQPSTQAPCSPPKIWQSWFMGGFQKRPNRKAVMHETLKSAKSLEAPTLWGKLLRFFQIL